MQHETLKQQLCGQVRFMIDRINQVPEPDRSTILQAVVNSFNKSLDQSYKQVPFVEVVNE